MKIPDYRKETLFECYYAHTGRIIDSKPYIDSFGISEQRRNNFINTNFRDGLTKEQAEHAIAILNSPTQ